MIIALLNQKGGVGKTTLATHLAGELTRASQSVILVDADPQGSALDWSQRREHNGTRRLFGVIGLPRETLHVEVPLIARHVDHVVIDGPPRVTALARSALLAADIALIPVQPSPYDVWASSDVVALVKEARLFRPSLQAAFVINRRVSRTVIGRQATAALEASNREPPTIDPLAAQVFQRIVFAESVAVGRLAFEVDADSAAALEISALANEIRSKAA